MADLRRLVRRARNGLREVAALPDKRRTLARWAAFEALRPLAPVVAVDRGEFRFYVSTRDRALARTVYLTGGYEPELIELAVRLIGEAAGEAAPLRDSWVVDVGANIGTSLVPLVARHGAAGGVGIEPDPLNFELLQMNLLANGVADRVRVARAGASDTDGSAELELSPSNFGDHRIRLSTPTTGNAYGEATRSTIAVPLRRLDGILADLEVAPADVGLLWIDTQGHEGRVLAGAPDLLAARPPVCLELWPYGLRRSDSLDLVLELAAAHDGTAVDLRATAETGSVVARPASRLDELVARLTDERYTDVLLLP